MHFWVCGLLFPSEGRDGCSQERQAWSVVGDPRSGNFSTCNAFQVLCRLVTYFNIICGCNHLARMCGFSTYKCYYLLFVSMYMTMLLLSMSTIFCLFFICTAARIIEGPANHTVPIGATVTFPCVAQGEDAFLEINTTAIIYPEDINPFIEKGFSLSEQYTATTFNLTLTVNARPENNNTMITCVVYPHDHPRDRHSGNLTVMGKLHH